jgi:hypothetical protein
MYLAQKINSCFQKVFVYHETSLNQPALRRVRLFTTRIPQGYSMDTERNNEVSQGYPVANGTGILGVVSTMSVQHTTRNRWNTWKSQCLYKVPQGTIPGALLTISIYGTHGIPEVLRQIILFM